MRYTSNNIINLRVQVIKNRRHQFYCLLPINITLRYFIQHDLLS